ncbi:hypothetical protein LINPERHAP2_LOCUS23194 [Linum perenne]
MCSEKLIRLQISLPIWGIANLLAPPFLLLVLLLSDSLFLAIVLGPPFPV